MNTEALRSKVSTPSGFGYSIGTASAADYDQGVVDALMPAMEKRARAMDAQPLPAEPTPNLVPR